VLDRRKLGILSTALALVLAGASGATAGSPPGPSFRATAPAVTGYILEGASDRVVDRDADALTTLGVADLTLAASGKGVTPPTDDALRLLGAAHAHGVRAEPLFSNWSNRLGAFDARAVARLLRHDGRVRRVATRLASYASDQGWDGITVDLERLRPADGPGLVLLVRELQSRMPTERTVTVDVSATTSARGYRDLGYRLGPLGRAADTIVLMAYDQHGAGWTGPGPVGALPWQRRSLVALTQRVPMAKVDLGVAGYGYTWPRQGTGHMVTLKGARRLVRRDGARAVWKARPGEWTARLSDGTVLWWSDGRSYDLRRDLAVRKGTHGLALWRLGSADSLD
jgi:spore germination protein